MVNDDLTVRYFWKLSSDLDEEDSWSFLSEDDGIEPHANNPDRNRPYSFQWNTNGFRDNDGDPLIPNESYDVGVRVHDLVCNSTDVVGATKRGEHGSLTFVDTICPIATIVSYDIDDEFECTPVRRNTPDEARVAGNATFYARILDGSTDTQEVKFYYRAPGGDWILMNVDTYEKDLDGVQRWVMQDWDSQPLAEGTYEMVAVARDDAGNECWDDKRSQHPAVDHRPDRSGDGCRDPAERRDPDA